MYGCMDKKMNEIMNKKELILHQNIVDIRLQM